MKSLSMCGAIGVASVVVLGCTRDGSITAPKASPPDAASLAVAPAACQSVSFTSESSGTFPFFPGTMTGDLEGTMQTLQDPSTVEVPNDKIAMVDGTIDFQVTGGSVAALVGRSFRTSASSSNRFGPDVDPTLGEISGKVRATDGISKANLTFHGFVDVTDGSPPFEVRLEWHGVVCP